MNLANFVRVGSLFGPTSQTKNSIGNFDSPNSRAAKAAGPRQYRSRPWSKIDRVLRQDGGWIVTIVEHRSAGFLPRFVRGPAGFVGAEI